MATGKHFLYSKSVITLTIVSPLLVGVEGVADGDLVDRELYQREWPTLAEAPTVRTLVLLPQQPQAASLQ